MVLHVELFGPVRYWVDEGEPQPVRYKRPAQLVAYLALAPKHRAAKAELQQELWSPAGDDVRPALRYVRRKYPVLAEWLSEDAEGVWLERRRGNDAIEVDALRVSSLVANGDYAAALDIPRGPFLGRFDSNASSWLSRARPHRHAELALACRELALVRSAQGRLSEAVDYAERRLYWRPFDVAATKELALLIAHDGRRPEARRRLVALLESGQVVDPSDRASLEDGVRELSGDLPPLPEPAQRGTGSAEITGSDERAEIFEVPLPRNAELAGRDAELTRLHEALRAHGPITVAQAISGEGGIGKTQLALEFAYRFKHDYDVVWWFAAENPDDLEQQYANLAVRLGLPDSTPEPSLALRVAAAREWLSSHRRWLVIFDNAEDPSAISRLLPVGGGDVVLTSRRQHWPPFARVELLDVLPLDAASGFVMRRTGSDDETSARRLADVTGGLPLALEQAAAYIIEHGISVKRYLELYAARAEELWERGEPSFYERTVATTWSLAMDEAERALPATVDLLLACSLFDTDGVPRALFEHASTGALPSLADELAREDALAVLRRYSLVRLGGQGQAILLHRLVGAHVRARQTKKRHLGREFVRAVAELLANWTRTALCEPFVHPNVAEWRIRQVRAFSDHVMSIDPATVFGIARLAAQVESRGAHLGGTSMLDIAVKAAEAAFGPRDERLGVVLVDRAVQRYNAMRTGHDEARELSLRDLRRALKIVEERFGEHSPQAGSIHAELARVLGDLRSQYVDFALEDADFEAAAQHVDHAIAIFRSHGEADSLAAALIAGADVAAHRGDLDLARQYFDEALAGDEPSDAQTRWHAVTRLRQAGMTLMKFGAVADAVPYLTRACEIQLAGDRPQGFGGYGAADELASALHELRDWERLAALYGRLVDEYAKEPDNWIYVHSTLNSLAAVEAELGREDASQQARRREIEVLEDAVRDACLTFLTQAGELSAAEAETLSSEVVESLLDRASAAAHRGARYANGRLFDSPQPLKDLVHALEAGDERPRAIELQRRAVDLETHEWQVEHAEHLARTAEEESAASSRPWYPDEPSRMHAWALLELGRLLTDQGDAEPALAAVNRALEEFEASDHFDIETRSSLFGVMARAEFLAGRKKHAHIAADAAEQALALDDEARIRHGAKASYCTTFWGVQRLAELRGNLEELDDAERLYRRALDLEEAAHGNWHPTVAAATYNLALHLHRRGETEEALAFAVRSREICERIFGETSRRARTRQALIDDLTSEVG